MANEYQPRPIRVDHVQVPDDLLRLVELLAEHVHDVWAVQRLRGGWTWGPERCDRSLKTPCLVAYPELSEDDKVCDREIVLGTVRAILALGYDISKKP